MGKIPSISMIFEKTKDGEKGVFGDIVSLFKENLSSGKRNFINVLELIQITLRLNFMNEEKNIIFNHIFNETINELDAKTRNLVLFHLKLEIEQLMEDKINDYHILFVKDNLFEKARFKVRSLPRAISLIAYCPVCDLYYPVEMDLLEYREESIYAHRYIIQNFLVGNIECIKCKISKIYVPNLL